MLWGFILTQAFLKSQILDDYQEYAAETNFIFIDGKTNYFSFIYGFRTPNTEYEAPRSHLPSMLISSLCLSQFEKKEAPAFNFSLVKFQVLSSHCMYVMTLFALIGSCP